MNALNHTYRSTNDLVVSGVYVVIVDGAVVVITGAPEDNVVFLFLTPSRQVHT